MRSASRHLLALAAVASIALPALAERGDDADRVSKNGRTEMTVGDVSVVVEYGRPSVRGREIWGGLVPFDQVWRTGADEATTFESSGDLLVQGETLPAGRYGLFTIPGETEWTVVFNSVADQWGAYDYDASKDVLRVTASPDGAEKTEALEFVADGSRLVLRWDTLALPIELSTP